MASLRNLTCKTNPVQRKRGGNAVAAAAYRAGENLHDIGSGQTHRYANRSPDIREAHLRSVEDAPDWHYDRAALWNDIEARETRKDARTGRDIVLGLAWELTPDQQREAVFEFADREFIERGYVCDIAFHRYGSSIRERDRLYDQQSGTYISGEERLAHWKGTGIPFLEAHQIDGVDMPHVKIERMKGGDISGYKIYHPHAHVLVSPRTWDSETGQWAAKKDPHQNRPETARNWRYDWPKVQNRYLEEAGWDVRISCTASEGDEALPIKTEALPNQSYHIEKREEQTTAQLEADFNRIQNEAIRASAADQETQPDGTPNVTTRVEEASTGTWWRNMREHFAEKRQAWRAHLRSSWDQLKDHWQKRQNEPEPGAKPENHIEAESTSDEMTVSPHGHTRGRWEHEP